MIIQKKDFAAKHISITPLFDDPKEYVTYDLQADDIYQLPGIAQANTLQHLEVPPYGCVLVQTKQTLHLPNDVFGCLAPKASLTTIGLMIANIKIDPNFHGKLTVCLFNASNKPITIKSEMAFCSIYFQCLESPISSTDLRSPPEMRPTDVGWFRRFIYEQKEAIVFFFAIAGLIVSIIAILKK